MGMSFDMSAAIISLEQILTRPVATVSDFFKAVLSGQPSGAFISVNRLEEGLSADTFRAELSFQDESEFDFFKQFALRTEDNPAELRLVNLRNAVVFPRLGLVVTEDNKLIDLSCKGYLSEDMTALEKLNEIQGFEVVDGCLSLDKDLLYTAEIVDFPSIYTMHFGIGILDIGCSMYCLHLFPKQVK